ncbi:MAG: hypothetical protein AMXMBFR47_44110 [Planctomycetota bacterium]
MRWVFKWAATVACGLTLMSLVASSFWWIVAVEQRLTSVGFGISGGNAFVAIPANLDTWNPRSGWSLRATVPDRWDDIRYAWELAPNSPAVFLVQGNYVVSTPLWVPLLVIGIPTAWLWWRDRRRVGPGGCLKCGYDLTGNVSGRCSECGAAACVREPE